MEKFDPDNQIRAIHDLTMKMLDSAQKGNWDILASFQYQRDPLMQSWMNISPDLVRTLSEEGRVHLAEIVQAEQQLIDLVKNQMEFLSDNIRGVALEYKVRRAYTKGS
ncbi:MAG: flagellar protein FliT [Pseudomonadota bacterium]|nr:flagellar protein FliT [Pseudomonadota bacterium]